MRITVLMVPDCPNVPVVRERIARALNGRGAEVELVEVTDEAQARALGMTGSPTVLVDGVDPFAVPGVPASVSCRRYRRADGTADGAPSVADLRRALDVAGGGASPHGLRGGADPVVVEVEVGGAAGGEAGDSSGRSTHRAQMMNPENAIITTDQTG